MKAIGIGSNQPALWAQDHGVIHLISMHLTLRTARRLAHENGSYTLLAAEHAKLKLATGTQAPSLEHMLKVRDERPEQLRWSWPQPQRTKHPRD